MKTKQEVEKEFREELSELLKKWKADISIEDYGRSYREDFRITASIPGEWDENGETTRQHADIDLGKWICN
jgi:hypothetical protein